MQLVIKIDDNLLNRIRMSNSIPDINGIDVVNSMNCIKNGTPIPEGHGDLKDVSDFNFMCKYFHDGDYGCEDKGKRHCQGCSDYAISWSDINDAETIIEADKESEEKDE